MVLQGSGGAHPRPGPRVRRMLRRMLLQYGLYLVVVPMVAWVGVVTYMVRRMEVPAEDEAPPPTRAHMVIATALCPLPIEACGKAAVLAIGPGARGGQLVCFETLLEAAAPRHCEIGGRAGHRLG